MVYKPKRAKFTKIDSISVADVSNLVDSAVSGANNNWSKVSNSNNDGLLFSADKDEL